MREQVGGPLDAGVALAEATSATATASFVDTSRTCESGGIEAALIQVLLRHLRRQRRRCREEHLVGDPA